MAARAIRGSVAGRKHHQRADIIFNPTIATIYLYLANNDTLHDGINKNAGICMLARACSGAWRPAAEMATTWRGRYEPNDSSLLRVTGNA